MASVGNEATFREGANILLGCDWWAHIVSLSWKIPWQYVAVFTRTHYKTAITEAFSEYVKYRTILLSLGYKAPQSDEKRVCSKPYDELIYVVWMFLVVIMAKIWKSESDRWEIALLVVCFADYARGIISARVSKWPFKTTQPASLHPRLQTPQTRPTVVVITHAPRCFVRKVCIIFYP